MNDKNDKITEEYKYMINAYRYSICSGQYEWYVYLTNINPLFVMGEIIYTSMCDIKKIYWNYYSLSKIEYWKEQGARIYPYTSKYWGKEL